MEKDLLDVLKMLSEKDNYVFCMFNGEGFLDAEISALCEIIMKQYKIPKDNDVVFEELMNFCDGDLSKKKLLEKYLLSNKFKVKKSKITNQHS